MDAINTFITENFGSNSMGIIIGVVAIVLIIIIGFFADRSNKRKHQETKINEDKSIAVEIKPTLTEETISEPQVTNVDQSFSTINNNETKENVLNEEYDPFEKTEVISHEPIANNETEEKDTTDDLTI
jgi:FtsZ-interacting cell division protein ZipA